MTKRPVQTRFFLGWTVQNLLAVLCALLLTPGETLLYAWQEAAPADQAAPKIPDDQLDSLVAPIALYPDPLLSQVLVASTYPLEIIQLQQWLQKNSTLKGEELTKAVQQQDWDPSIQAMAVLPDVAKRLADDIKWTTDLGNAFLAQQSDVMDAVQRMRMKAKDAGNLKSNEQMKVETKVVETQTVVVIEQTNPQVIYVPTYNPVVVYGPPVYPYPPIYYPPQATMRRVPSLRLELASPSGRLTTVGGATAADGAAATTTSTSTLTTITSATTTKQTSTM